MRILADEKKGLTFDRKSELKVNNYFNCARWAFRNPSLFLVIPLSYDRITAKGIAIFIFPQKKLLFFTRI